MTNTTTNANAAAGVHLSVLIVDDDPFIRESLSLLIGMDPQIEVLGTACHGLEAVNQLESGGMPVPDVVLMDIRMPECDGVEGTKRIKALFPQTSVLILTTFDDDEFIIEALQSGASGYLLKNIPPSRIIEGIKTVHSGSMLIHPDIARKLTGMLRADAHKAAAGAEQSAGNAAGRSEQRPGSASSGKASSSSAPSGKASSGSASSGGASSGSASSSSDSAAPADSVQSKLRAAGLTPAEQNVVALIADGMSNKEIAQKLFLSEGTVKNYITDILAKLQVRDRTQLAILYWKSYNQLG
ncbi:response regulator transcription factor [Paenibacillus woosongensis]|uniref:Response regulator transcription factor n=1 Tax=Paenibacillus woosongensis TaxID=307580 RepID=A0AA95KWI9_9BACL|nr:response regulator transcription factor [Paenibacillus woosongensis]WHX49690.1 response regulator transcription factor [Paenibacillus woosongensis]